MSKYISEDILLEDLWDSKCESDILRRVRQAIVDEIIGIEGIDIVRCGECKWLKANGTYQWCGRLDSTAKITDDDFCSYGSRSEKPNNSTISKMEQVDKDINVRSKESE